jgi:thiol:disulfide interchange protein/DsbC/DsbD-like thiol-disulfide interchange protein
MSAALLSLSAQLAMAAQDAEPSSFVQTEQVRAELVAETASVHPGQTLTVGLHQKIIPHWHTYWLNPGDSGLATTLAWQLPPGVSAGPIQWPIPHRFTQGPVTNHGYADEVTLLSELKVPPEAKPGQPLVLQAKASWLVCAEVCIPQNGLLSLSVPVVAKDAPVGTSHALIVQARAQLPTQPSWAVGAALKDKQLVLSLPAKAHEGAGRLKEAWFYPADWGVVAHNAPQPQRIEGEQLHLALTPGEAPLAQGKALRGVLVLTHELKGQEVRQGFEIAPVLGAAPAAPVASRDAPAKPERADTPGAALDPHEAPSLGLALVLAFTGGLILNLMPCVFPVLSIKALSLLSHTSHRPAQARLQGLAYTAGVLASFGLLALAMLALKAGGAQVGWGFQFQSPGFVLVVAYLMLAVGLSLSGVFTIGASVTGVGGALADKPGLSGSFFTGVLATVVATPCTAPFMGGAIGFALGQPAAVVLAVFLSLGLGLAVPYLLLSTWPALQRWLPRPGAWMERFKQALAFPMYAAAAWLVWVLAQQADANAVGAALLGMVGIAFAAWLYDATRQSTAWRPAAGLLLALLTVSGVIGSSLLSLEGREPQVVSAASPSGKAKAWSPYDPVAFQQLRADGKPVFLNFTAAWCITCLANERVALSQAPVQEAFKAQGITYLKGDWTRQDPAITEVLRNFDRSGVPLYVYYPAGIGSKPVVLPQILTPDVVLQALRDAAPKTGVALAQPALAPSVQP